jgi:hypothetical protein
VERTARNGERTADDAWTSCPFGERTGRHSRRTYPRPGSVLSECVDVTSKKTEDLDEQARDVSERVEDASVFGQVRCEDAEVLSVVPSGPLRRATGLPGRGRGPVARRRTTARSFERTSTSRERSCRRSGRSCGRAERSSAKSERSSGQTEQASAQIETSSSISRASPALFGRS